MSTVRLKDLKGERVLITAPGTVADGRLGTIVDHNASGTYRVDIEDLGIMGNYYISKLTRLQVEFNKSSKMISYRNFKIVPRENNYEVVSVDGVLSLGTSRFPINCIRAIKEYLARSEETNS